MRAGEKRRPPPPHPPKINSATEIAKVAQPGYPYREHPRYNEFGDAWEAFPARNTRESRRQAFVCWLKLVLRGVKPEQIFQACLQYAFEVRDQKVDPKHVMMFATFLGPQARWEAYVEEEA